MKIVSDSHNLFYDVECHYMKCYSGETSWCHRELTEAEEDEKEWVENELSQSRSDVEVLDKKLKKKLSFFVADEKARIS